MSDEMVQEVSTGRRPGEYFDGYRWRSAEGDDGEDGPQSTKASALAYQLSERELEILHMMASKMTAKQMSDKLAISPRTVQFHQLNLYWKLGISGRESRTLAVDKGRKLGLLK